MIRIVLPQHLQVLAGAPREVTVDVAGTATVHTILTALEAKYPTLRGAIRDHDTRKRRPMVRFFTCQEDISLDPDNKPLPDAIASGTDASLHHRARGSPAGSVLLMVIVLVVG